MQKPASISAICLSLSTISVLFTIGPAAAQTSCAVADITHDMPPPALVRVVRDCVSAGDSDGAVRAFVIYNAFTIFDRQRVADETAHAVVVTLNQDMVAGLSPDQLAGMRGALDRFRTPTDPIHAEICNAMRALGPPMYRPDYMIRTGSIPLKTEDDWKTEGFDPVAGWKRATEEFNGCRSN